MEPFLGQVQIFGFNFPPRGWALCDGQLLPISQYQALFALLGTQFGGDGRTTFALPDLRGRRPVHVGQGAGLSNIRIGQRSGYGDVSLTLGNLPAHSHTGSLRLGAGPGLEGSGDGQYLASNSAGETIFSTVPPATGQLAAGALSIGAAGNSVPFSIENPWLAIGYSIAISGLFPSRS